MMAESKSSDSHGIFSPRESVATPMPRRDWIGDGTATVAAAPGARTQDQSLSQRHFFRKLFRVMKVTDAGVKLFRNKSDKVVRSSQHHDYAHRGAAVGGMSPWEYASIVQLREREKTSGPDDAEDTLLNQAYQAHVDYEFYAHQCNEQLHVSVGSSTVRSIQ